MSSCLTVKSPAAIDVGIIDLAILYMFRSSLLVLEINLLNLSDIDISNCQRSDIMIFI